MLKTYDINVHLKKLGKKQLIRLKYSRKDELVKIRGESMKQKMNLQQRELTKSIYLKRLENDKFVARLVKIKRKKSQVINVSNEKR